MKVYQAKKLKQLQSKKPWPTWKFLAESWAAWVQTIVYHLAVNRLALWEMKISLLAVMRSWIEEPAMRYSRVTSPFRFASIKPCSRARSSRLTWGPMHRLWARQMPTYLLSRCMTQRPSNLSTRTRLQSRARSQESSRPQSYTFEKGLVQKRNGWN